MPDDCQCDSVIDWSGVLKYDEPIARTPSDTASQGPQPDACKENRPLKAVFFRLPFLQLDAEFSNPNPGSEAFHGGQAGPDAHGFTPRAHG